MRARSLARAIARKDVCIFCAFRSIHGSIVTKASRPRATPDISTTLCLQRPFGTEAAAKDSDESADGPTNEGWGALGVKLGVADSNETFHAPQPRMTREAEVEADSPRASGRREFGGNRNPERRTGGDSDRLVDRVPQRPRRRNGPTERSEYQLQQQRLRPQPSGGRYGPLTMRPSFLNARDREPDEEEASQQAGDTANTSVSQREGRFGNFGNRHVPSRGHIGGLDDLLNHTERSNRLLKQQQEASNTRRQPDTSSYRKSMLEDFDSEAPKKSQRFVWNPDEGSEPIQTVNEDIDAWTENAERSRRLDRFGDAGPVAVAQQPARPSRTRVRRGRTDEEDFNSRYDEEEFLENTKRKKGKKGKKAAPAPQEAAREVPISDFVSVENLAKLLKIRINDFIRRLEDMGFEALNGDHILDGETAALIAQEYNYVPVMATSTVADLTSRLPAEDKSVLPARPPIITIMGHVDHGKTTILDYLRKSSIAASEHGGITQHIGAFSVRMPGVDRYMTFLDTPGHAAFLEMRRRGANVTDIVILVVAADDGVKPQTIEAIKHALDARVQIIVAINKIDKHDADPEHVKHELTRHGIEVEDVGGNIQAIAVSGKTGQGMQDLEEAILALSEAEDYRAETDGQAEGWIIESNVTQAGRLATVLVRRGTMRPGDYIVAGTTWTRIRTLRDDGGNLIDEAAPGTPVVVDGWRDQPLAGLEVLQAEDEQQAKDVVEMRSEREDVSRMTGDAAAINAARREEAEVRAKVLAWEAEQSWARLKYQQRPKDNEGWVEPEAKDGLKRINLVVKADVTGSVEAVVNALASLGNSEVGTNIIRSGVGPVSLSDIQHVSATGAQGYIVSFNQGIDGEMHRLAEAAGVGILDHNIIYRVTDAVKEKLEEQLPPIIKQKVHGEAEIGQVFDVTVKKVVVKVAGCKVTNGTISRDRRIRVSRGSEVVYDGKLNSLKNVKKDVTEMRKGTECGLGFDNWQDFMVGDTIQAYEEIREKRVF